MEQEKNQKLPRKFAFELTDEQRETCKKLCAQIINSMNWEKVYTNLRCGFEKYAISPV